MEIKHETNDSKGAFYVEKDGARLAEMTYSKAGEGMIIIDHTQVDDSLRGEGVGKKLVEKGVGFARENDLKVLPLCPFAKAIIDKTPEFQDVLKK
jgi:uncharacterized protein